MGQSASAKRRGFFVALPHKFSVDEVRRCLMPAQQPADLHRLISETLAAGNREAALALCETDAAFVTQPGQVANGAASIAAAIDAFIGLKPDLRIQEAQVIQAADIALLRSKWTLTGTGPDGQPTEMAGEGPDVARRQDDGTWRYVIDHPWGAS